MRCHHPRELTKKLRQRLKKHSNVETLSKEFSKIMSNPAQPIGTGVSGAPAKKFVLKL